nr:immunoglobulin light chain junction region [Macaca mulatta]MOV65855.1 immunoglobulin light chain junction region [Macaca mulatta]MOV65896.1 immunoglobulin light chain junction region [Macaca mulatta]MOV65905.1 immunoglobulin light chain junction region [Macaca mulatta]MOV66093.1 immunoglobulin light chain junction region [Macaca mulatta]
DYYCQSVDSSGNLPLF